MLRSAAAGAVGGSARILATIAAVSEAWANFRVQFQSPGTTTIGATMLNECSWEYDYSTGECNCAFYLQVSAQVRTNAVRLKPYAGSLIPIDNGGDGVIAQGSFTLGVRAVGSGASGSRPRRDRGRVV